MEMLTYQLEYNQTLFVNLAVNVKNTKDLKQSVIQGNLKCSLVNSKYILDVFQIAVAANRAVVTQNNNKLITRNIYTELLYNLSPSKIIKVALETYGVMDSDDNFLICVIGNSGEESAKMAEDVCNAVDGTFKFPSPYELKNVCHEDKIIEQYKVTKEELCVSDLLNSVVTKIASKGYIK